MSAQPETSALLCDCILSFTHGSTHVAGVLQLATCHPHKKLSVLQMLCKRNCMLCRKVTVKRLRMSKQEAVVYEHAKTAALQQMQASHKSVCQLSKVPCCAIASKRIGFDMSPDSPDCKRPVTLTITQQSSQINESVEALKLFSKFGCSYMYRRELTSVQERLRLSGQDLQLDQSALHPLLCLCASDKPASTPACSLQFYFPRPTAVLPMMRRTLSRRQR